MSAAERRLQGLSEVRLTNAQFCSVQPSSPNGTRLPLARLFMGAHALDCSSCRSPPTAWSICLLSESIYLMLGIIGLMIVLSRTIYRK